jgi:hypothetical protein
MAYWHMDRARYYASVGDDARALRHLSKFGTTEADRTRNELTECKNARTLIVRTNEENRRKLTDEKEKLTAELQALQVELDAARQSIPLQYTSDLDTVTNNAKSKFDKLQNEIKRLNGLVEAGQTRESVMLRARQYEMADAEAGRRSPVIRRAPENGGCSVM